MNVLMPSSSLKMLRKSMQLKIANNEMDRLSILLVAILRTRGIEIASIMAIRAIPGI